MCIRDRHSTDPDSPGLLLPAVPHEGRPQKNDALVQKMEEAPFHPVQNIFPSQTGASHYLSFPNSYERYAYRTPKALSLIHI